VYYNGKNNKKHFYKKISKNYKSCPFYGLNTETRVYKIEIISNHNSEHYGEELL